jgi:UDP-glucose 4-epimerase
MRPSPFNNALAETIRQLAGSRSEIVHAAKRAGDVKHSVADTGKFRAAGFFPPAKIQEALPATIRWFQTLPTQLPDK